MDAPATEGRNAALDWLLARDIEAEAEAIVAAVSATGPDATATVEFGPDDPATYRLNERQRAVLEFERRWWRQPGAKEQAIRESFAMSPTRYYQVLNTLLDLPQALTYDPALVHRLQRLRAAPRARRPR